MVTITNYKGCWNRSLTLDLCKQAFLQDTVFGETKYVYLTLESVLKYLFLLVTVLLESILNYSRTFSCATLMGIHIHWASSRRAEQTTGETTTILKWCVIISIKCFLTELQKTRDILAYGSFYNKHNNNIRNSILITGTWLDRSSNVK